MRFGAELRTAKVSRIDLSRPGPSRSGWAIPRPPSRPSWPTRSSWPPAPVPSCSACPNEGRLLGYGVSTCATCDGFFFRDQHIAVAGGGDSAMEEAIFLARFASKVTVIHRRDELRASKIMQDRAFANPKITFKWNSVITDVVGDTKVAGLRLRDTMTGEQSDLNATGLFVAIGHEPNTSLLKGQIELEDNGYVADVRRVRRGPAWTASSPAATSRTHYYRQAITSAGSGCMAAIDAERWLEDRGE